MKTTLLGAVLLALGAAPGFAQVDSAAETAQSAPNVIEAVECRGNARTSCDYIRRKLALPNNARADDEAVRSARLRLSALPIFESVFLRLEKGSEKGKALLIVEVVEASPYGTELAAGVIYHTSEFPDDYFASIESESWRQQLFGRISNQNLFGRQKIAALGVTAAHSADSTDIAFGISRTNNDADANNASVFATYIDPALAGVDRLFLSAGISYAYSRTETDFSGSSNSGERESTSNSASVGISVGAKFWDYAFVLAGYNYVTSERNDKTTYVFPFSQVQHSEYDTEFDAWRLGIGWDSEDDAYFPTRGMRVSIFATYLDDEERIAQPQWSAAFKQTWSHGRAAWTLNVGGEPGSAADELRPYQFVAPGGLAVTYARSTSSQASTNDGAAMRGRWYVQLSGGPVELSRDGRIGGDPTVAAAKIGVRWESKVLGVVDLFAMGMHEWRRPQ